MDCAARLVAPGVSRHHPQDGSWWARDLESSNGTLVNGRPIDRLPLVGTTTLEFGREGPRIRVTVPPPAPTPDENSRSLEDVSRHYFDTAFETSAGEHTMLIRRAFQEAWRRQSRVYLTLIFIVVLMLTAVSGVAFFQYLELQEKANLANDKFYATKELELHMANFESERDCAHKETQSAEETRSTRLRAEIEEARRRLARMREAYNASAEAYVHKRHASRFLPGRFPPGLLGAPDPTVGDGFW